MGLCERSQQWIELVGSWRNLSSGLEKRLRSEARTSSLREDSPEIAAGLFGKFVLLGCGIVAVSLLVAEGPEVEAVEDQWFNDQAGPFGAVEFRAGLGSICVVLLEVCPFVA